MMRLIKTFNNFGDLSEKVLVKQKQDSAVSEFNDAGDMKIDKHYKLTLDGKDPVGDAFINVTNFGNIALREITIADGLKNKGIGTKFMEQLCDAADANNRTIVLTPDSYKGSSVTRLKNFYKGFGFVENKGRNKDFEIWESMYRLPANANESYKIPKKTREFYLKTNKLIAKNLGLYTSDDHVLLFHGSSASNMKKIIKSGMLLSGTWLATDLKTAQRYALTKDEGKGATDSMMIYMGSIIYNSYFSTQEDLFRVSGGFYSPKDI